MAKLLDIIEKTLYEAEENSTKPDITINTDELSSQDIHALARRVLLNDGFVPVLEPHPAIRKLLNQYNRYNPTVYEMLSPANCVYCKSTNIKTACVFYNPIDKKFCLAYNPRFINEQIEGFEELLNSGVAKSWTDSKMDEADIPMSALKKLNFLIAHEIDHILKGDLERFGKVSGTANPTDEMQKMHNIASDAVNNQELLDTAFRLGGPVGYKFIEGGMLSTRNADLFKKYDIDGDKAVIISEISKKNPWKFEENSETYYKWMMSNIDEYDKYMDEHAMNNKDDEDNEGGDGGDGGGGGEDNQNVIYRVGDPIVIPELGKYGKITAINGDDVTFEEISAEEAKAIAKAKPRLGFARAASFAPENIGPFEKKMCEMYNISISHPLRRYSLIRAVYERGVK